MPWLLATAFLARLLLALLPGLPWDMGSFLSWSAALAARGPGGFYGSLWCDYLPGYLYVLWGLGLLYGIWHPGLEPGRAYALLIKLPPILADLGIAALIYRWAGRGSLSARPVPAVLAALFLFNPAVLLNGAVWGQADSVTALLLVGAFFLLQKREGRSPWAGAALAGTAAITKPQALVLLPLLALWTWRTRAAARSLGLAAAAVAAAALLALPFTSAGAPWDWLLRQYAVAARQYTSLSLNAFNLWALFGFWRQDSEALGPLSFLHWGLLLFSACYACVLWTLHRDPSKLRLLGAGALASLAAFLLLTRMHERYAFAALPFMLLAAAEGRSRPWLACYLALSATTTLNLGYVLYYYGPKLSHMTHPLTPWIESSLARPWAVADLSLANLAIGAGAAFLVFGTDRLPTGSLSRFLRAWAGGGSPTRAPARQAGRPQAAAPTSRLESKDARIAAAFFLCACALYLPRLGFPSEQYFDEVHHVKTALQFLHGQEPTEWTHPHLGKLLMAASMLLFGENSFAWRLPQALAGAGTVALTYLLAAGVRGRRAGTLAALLFLLDGLQFALSRIGMLDAHLGFFLLLSYCIFARRFFLEWRPSNAAFAALGASLGMMLATKWIGLYAYAVILALLCWTVLRRLRDGADPPGTAFAHAARILNFLMLLPALLYLLSYFRYAQIGHGFGEVLRYQVVMWDYHAGIRDTHPYTSPWWSWPLLLRPVWAFFRPSAQSSSLQGIVFLGNPAVFWLCAPAMAFLAWEALRARSRACFLILAGFCGQYLPWAISPRPLLFLHHFYSALPFLCIAVACALDRLLDRPGGRWAVGAYLALVLASFLYFYPLLSGWRIPWSAYTSRMWLKSWI